MSTTLALQLYTIRDEMEKDFEGAIRRIAEMGIHAVETACIPAKYPPKEARKIFDRHGISVVSAHTALPIGDNEDTVLAELDAYDCTRFVSGLSPEDVSSPAKLDVALGRCFDAAEVGIANGISLFLHNHWWEFGNNGAIFDDIVRKMSRDISLELDVYWCKTAGCDPVQVIRKYADRIPLLHMKDGPAVKDQPMTAAGTGVLDMPAIIKAGKATVQHYIIELDSCATDMMTAVRQSYDYLARQIEA